jgi:hypothetical protein
MLSIHTILHPTDFSDCSRYAFRLAGMLVSEQGARLVILHGKPTLGPLAAHGKALAELQPEVSQEKLLEVLYQFRVSDPKVQVEHRLVNRGVQEIPRQAPAALNRSQGGIGVGLAMVGNLVQLHGGTVQAFSDGLGQGSEFVVRLPLPSAAYAGRGGAGETRDLSAESPPRRILVADDNGDLVEAVAQLLRRRRSQFPRSRPARWLRRPARLGRALRKSSLRWEQLNEPGPITPTGEMNWPERAEGGE